MSFSSGKRNNSVVTDCQAAVAAGEPHLVEQSHKKEVDINNIIKKHGGEMIANTALLASASFRFDDVTTNDFSEAMEILARAKESFDKLPPEIRSRFNHQPEAFLDYVQNPANTDELVALGLAKRPPGWKEPAILDPTPDGKPVEDHKKE
jgi:phage internal scaffolding protein